MFTLINRGELPATTEHEFENFNSRLKGLWLVEHNDDGTHNLPASAIPDLDASIITSGEFDSDLIPDLDASKITSGAFDKARQHAQTAYKDEANTWTLLQTVSAGIKFPATQAASSDANVLDDYEEGSFTPVINASGGVSGQTYSTQLGRYIKIGRQVIVQGYMVLTTKGTMTGNVQISGLPFTAQNTASLFGAMECQWFTLNTGYVYLSLEVTPNQSYLALYGNTAAATSNAVVPESAIANGTQLVFGGCYRTDN